MTATKVAGVALASLVGLALASTSASAQGYGPGPDPAGGWWAWHNGLTVEVSIGLGYLYLKDGNGNTSQSDIALAGVNASIGGFIAPNMAISLREASNTYSEGFGDNSVTISSLVIGPHIQYWLTPQLWLGGGGGLAYSNAFFGNGDGTATVSSDSGLGLDFRAGVTFGQRWRRSYNLSLEITPAFYGDVTLTGVSVEFGYQFL